MELLKSIRAFAKQPDIIAYIHNEQKLTYFELVDKAERLAYYLDQTLEDDMTPIPVYGHKDPLMLICFLACVFSGRAYCPIDTGMPQSRVETILEAIDSKIILSIEHLDIVHHATITKAQIGSIIETCAHPIDDKKCVHDEDIFYIIFTSGSTGIPKGVEITYDNLNHFLNWSLPLVGANDMGNIFINQAPFSFDLSVMDVYSSLASGGTLYALDKDIQMDYANLFQSLHVSHASIWVSTPSFADMCLIDKSFSANLMPYLNCFFFCGETLTNETAKKLKERFPMAKVINTYGPTESTVAISDVLITTEILETQNPLPIGKAKKGTWIYIYDKANKVVEDGNKGEIIIVGDTVGKGYFNNPENTNMSFFTHEINGLKYAAYHTGDIGYVQDGMLYYCGRMDLQIKLNGYRIELLDIEQNLLKVPHVENAVVLPNMKNGKVKNLVACIVYQEDSSDHFQVGQVISRQLKQYIPDYMIPKKYIFLDEIPMTNNGKVDRRMLEGELS